MITCLITFSGINVRLTSLSFPHLPFPSRRWEQYLLSSSCQEPLLITTAFQRCFRVALQQATTLASSFSTYGCILCNLFNCTLPWTSSTEGKSSFLQSLALFHRPGIAGVVLPVNMKAKVSSTLSFMTRSPFPFRCTNRSSMCVFLPSHVSASTSSMLFVFVRVSLVNLCLFCCSSWRRWYLKTQQAHLDCSSLQDYFL